MVQIADGWFSEPSGEATCVVRFKNYTVIPELHKTFGLKESNPQKNQGDTTAPADPLFR